MRQIILLAIIAFGTISCAKEVCTTCKEVNSTVLPESYCGDPKKAKDWEKNLKENYSTYGKEWICNKQKFK
jgi:hypothetical protein